MADCDEGLTRPGVVAWGGGVLTPPEVSGGAETGGKEDDDGPGVGLPC